NGPNTASDVLVQDLLPPGLTFVSAAPSQGTYNSTTGAWTVGTVDPSTPRTLALTARVVSPVAQTNTVAISHSDQFDPNTGNNSGTPTATPPPADLRVTNPVSDPIPNVGHVIPSPISPTDFGPDSATNVQVPDLLPSGLTFVSAAPTQGTYNSATGVWD